VHGVLRVIGGGGVHVCVDDPADRLARLYVDANGVEPHVSAKGITLHVDLDDGTRPPRARHGEAGEREPAGREKTSPCEQRRADYFTRAS
jgi:hypothetical protein